MTFPTLVTEIAVTTRPTESPVWVDVSARTFSIRVRRGRSDERQQADVGTCEIVLDNTGRLFDPSYADGTYYGNLLPLRRIRVTATFTMVEESGITSTWEKQIFTGYVDGWPQTWEEAGTVPIVKIRASDGLKVLGFYELNTTFSAETTDTRIDNVLDAVGWTAGLAWVLDSATNSELDDTTILAPNGDRLLMAGNTTVVAADLENANALQHIYDVAQSEDGLFYMSGAGTATFENRHHRIHPQQMTPLATFNDDGTGVGYTDYQIDYNDENVRNDIRVTREDGEEQTASDATSQLVYFKRTYSEDRLLMDNDTEALDRANWLLSRYKDPHFAARNIEFVMEAGSTDTTTPQYQWYYTDRELNDRIQVVRHPAGSTSPITNDYHILAMEDQIGLSDLVGGRRWEKRWTLGSVDPISSYWNLVDSSGDLYAGYSELEATTILAY